MVLINSPLGADTAVPFDRVILCASKEPAVVQVMFLSNARDGMEGNEGLRHYAPVQNIGRGYLHACAHLM